VNLVQYPGMAMTLTAAAFVAGMLALRLHVPQAVWRVLVALFHFTRRATLIGRRLVTHGVDVARQVRHRAASLARHLPVHPPFLTRRGRCRVRLIVLDADPASRRLRTEQLRVALAVLGRAYFGRAAGRVAVEIAGEARFRGATYVAYLLRDQRVGVTRVRLASRTPDGAAIGVDIQHTYLADLFVHLVHHDPVVAFVGLPAADPSSPVVTGPLPPGAVGTCHRETGCPPRELAALAPGAPSLSAAAIPTAKPTIGDPATADLDIPYDDCDAPAQ